MSELTLPLAVFNLLPIIFTGLALWWIVGLVGSMAPSYRALAWFGAALMLFGGLAKATWKLVLVTMDTDLPWLATALFPLLGPGFICLAGAVAGAWLNAQGHARTRWVQVLVGMAITIAFAAVAIRTLGMGLPRGWFLPLLSLTTLGNLALSLLLIGMALKLGHPGAAVLFGINLLLIFALPPIALASPDTLAMHWLEQILTAVGTAAFAVGAYRLRGSSGWRAAQRRIP